MSRCIMPTCEGHAAPTPETMYEFFCTLGHVWTEMDPDAEWREYHGEHLAKYIKKHASYLDGSPLNIIDARFLADVSHTADGASVIDRVLARSRIRKEESRRVGSR